MGYYIFVCAPVPAGKLHTYDAVVKFNTIVLDYHSYS